MNKKIVLSFFICFFSTLTFAKSLDSLTGLDLDKELKSFKSLNVFDGPISKNKLSSLAKVKLHQVERRLLDCQKSGINLIASSEVKEWLATVILQCSLAAVEGKKSSGDLKKAVDIIYKLKLDSGSWKSSFGDVWSLSHVRLFDDSSSIDSKAKVLDSWAKPWDLLSKEQQAAWMQAKADLMMAQKKNAEAAFFLKQSQDLFPSKNFNDKIQSLLGLKTESIGKSVSAVESVMAAEQKMDDEIQKLLSSNRALPAQKLMVESLKQFPQGKQVKKYKEKILDIYFSQNKEKQEEALNNLLSAPEDRLLDWAQTLHRRGEFKAALLVSVNGLKNSQASSFLWIIGRSAHFTGQIDKALQAFEQLSRQYAGTDEAIEGQFRTGLILFRKEKFAAASVLFEQVKNSPRDKFQLNAWYWFIRCLQKENVAQSEIERDALIARYPFSYYGLRLRAEKNEGQISFPEVVAETSIQEQSTQEKSTMPLLPHQHLIWKRFKILAESGWVLEAQQEISGLPQPVTSSGLWKWAQLLAKAHQSQLVIVLTNRLIEQDSSYRNPQFMIPSFPKSYAAWIEPEAKKYNIDPFLIRSLVRQESAFSLRAISTSNAMGLMQMIPPTADEIARKLKMKVQIPEDMYRPEINVPMGTFYVAEMLRLFSQNVPMALAAYNAGPSRLKSWLELRPEVASLRENHRSEPMDELWFDELPWTETSFYVKSILRNILIYKFIDKGPVKMGPIFWSDLLTKTTAVPASIIVK